MFPTRLLSLVLSLFLGCSASAAERLRLQYWSFHEGELPEEAGVSKPAATDWRSVIVPHDWSIEHAPSPSEASGNDGGFFHNGTGWYRAWFDAPTSWKGQQVSVEFAGVSSNATVWINGTELGAHAYAYTPFVFDLTPHLKFGERNWLVVRAVNAPQPNSRWYTGSGIFRPVEIVLRRPVHLAPQSVFVRTRQVDESQATLQVEATARNTTDTARGIDVRVRILDATGRVVGSARTAQTVQANAEASVVHSVTVDAPRRWSPDSPALYRAMVSVRADGAETDTETTSFGIRTLGLSPERGFELNGKPIKLFGGNLHHDNGPLGAAAFRRAEERKVELMKQAGFNAVRTSHNPPSTEFLDACDRLGLLVLDEAFDGWAKKKTKHGYSEVFNDQWRDDVQAFVLRDRNHPSVVLWSIGNEMYERASNDGFRLAQEITAHIKSFDPSRPVTAGVNAPGKNGDWSKLDSLFAPLDVSGYNYELARSAQDHERLPNRVILGTESYVREVWSTHQLVHQHPYVIGDFLWSALDYLGEAGIGRVFGPDDKPFNHWEGNNYPWHGAACGDIDLTGLRKPYSHYRNIVWDRGEKLYLAVRIPSPDGRALQPSMWAPPPLEASWDWPGHEGRPLEVEVYSRADSVKLFLDGKLVGEKPAGVAQECKAVFTVPYQPGRLRVLAANKGIEGDAFELVTAGAATALRLRADRTQVWAGSQDVCFVTVEVVDAAGNAQPRREATIQYEVKGPAIIAGIGSADLTTKESYQQNPRKTFKGRAVVVLRTTDAAGEIVLTASAEGLSPAELRLSSRSR